MGIPIVLLFLASSDTFEPLFSVPQGFPKPVYDFTKNPLTIEKVELGRRLFYEPLLSRDGTISCASCHLSYTGFTHIDHSLSHGIDNRIGTRNSLALVNLAWNKTFMWDGAVNHLDMQALAPLSSRDEMDENMAHVVQKLQQSNRYPRFFQQAFGDSSVTGERILKVISQFMLTLVSANAKYDKVMRNEASFNEYEAKGYELFKKHCASCHTEPLFTHSGFENNGLKPDSILNDKGRMTITGRKEDSLLFKVPTLRNIEVTYPYMHDGRLPNLQMVLYHYTEGVYQSSTLAKQLRLKMPLSEEDKVNIIAFLHTLTDETFLRNPKFQYLR
ncbi:MAG: c-type cytochrome [Saprospiraceae bacterium]|nr:c-type cytochrome [Saprospiraceae bacterium]